MNKEYKESEENLRKFIEENEKYPDNDNGINDAELRCYLGLALYRQEKYKEAETELKLFENECGENLTSFHHFERLIPTTDKDPSPRAFCLSGIQDRMSPWIPRSERHKRFLLCLKGSWFLYFNDHMFGTKSFNGNLFGVIYKMSQPVT
jgi:hypothetical protein